MKMMAKYDTKKFKVLCDHLLEKFGVTGTIINKIFVPWFDDFDNNGFDPEPNVLD